MNNSVVHCRNQGQNKHFKDKLNDDQKHRVNYVILSYNLTN